MDGKTLVQIPWTETIPLDAIRLGCRSAFLDHYSQEEQDETFYFDSPNEVK
jgi:hypothetical protein